MKNLNRVGGRLDITEINMRKCLIYYLQTKK